MKGLSISNIAWPKELEIAVAAEMRRAGFTGVEIAPTKIWPDVLRVSDGDIEAYRAFWRNEGIEIVAMQALLFGRPELKIFEDETTRQKTRDYLQRIIELGGRLGARALVFGSPGNRRRGELAAEEAWKIAVDFFRSLGETATKCHTCLCIEANPLSYGCDFVTDTAAARKLVLEVQSPGFGLHFDTGASHLNQEDLAAELTDSVPPLHHVHLSEPELALITAQSRVNHARVIQLLTDLQLPVWASIEMRSPPDEILARVAQSLSFISQLRDSQPATPV